MNQYTHIPFTPKRPSAVARMKRERRKQSLIELRNFAVGVVIGVALYFTIVILLVASGAGY